jgi:hypothetical protein
MKTLTCSLASTSHLRALELLMPNIKIVDNRNRPAQPEPGEDPAVQSPPIREQAREAGIEREEIERAERHERKRQTGQ